MLNLIDRLEALVNEGTRIPMTARAMIDEREFTDIIDQLRVSLPEELRQARRIIQDRDRLLAEARAEAERIANSAQEQAAFMLQDNQLMIEAQNRANATINEANEMAAQIIAQAEAQANEIVAVAHRQAEEIRQGADNYAKDVLRSLDEQLNKHLVLVRNGLAVMNRTDGGNDLR